MALGPQKRKVIFCNFIGIYVEEDKILDGEEEVVVTEITEMSVESILECIIKNEEEEINNEINEKEMSTRAKLFDMAEEFEYWSRGDD